MDETKLHVAMMRSQLGRVRGLGAAKSGTGHWWAQRITAIALVPLSLWFIFSILAMAGGGQPAVAHWASHPLVTVLLLCLVIATFYHLQLGLQVVIEDYIHVEASKLATILAMKAITILLGLTAIVAVLKLAF